LPVDTGVRLLNFTIKRLFFPCQYHFNSVSYTSSYEYCSHQDEQETYGNL